MELDEVKKIWNEMDALKEKLQVNDNRIKEMLKKEGKSALDRLMKAAKIYSFIMIPLGFWFCLCSYKFFEAGGYYVICPLIFLLICVVSTPLEIYLYRWLKEIDFSKMSVKEVSERILKYQNMVQKGQLYGTAFFFIYLGIWYYLYYKLTIGTEIVWELIIFMSVIYLSAGLFLIPFLYKKLYYNNINQIKESLRELREFGEG